MSSTSSTKKAPALTRRRDKVTAKNTLNSSSLVPVSSSVQVGVILLGVAGLIAGKRGPKID